MPNNNDVTFSMGSSAYADRVPRRLKFFYAIGASAETIFGVAFNAFNFFFYTDAAGAPLAFVGVERSQGLHESSIAGQDANEALGLIGGDRSWVGDTPSCLLRPCQ